MARPNLTVVTEVHVTQVLFQGSTAVGVGYKYVACVYVSVCTCVCM
jgi:choline dehydrogenase-like flavoprotein